MIRCYKNGNIDIRIDKDTLKELRNKCGNDRLTYYNQIYYIVCTELDSYDTCVVGDPFCMGNDCIAYKLYCYRTDKSGILLDRDIYKLMSGSCIKITMSTPDKYEREQLKEMLG